LFTEAPLSPLSSRAKPKDLRLFSSNHFSRKRHSPLCPPERSRRICGSFPATTFHRSATLPFVIPSGAEGSAALFQQPLFTEALPSPLSSRAEPRDLRLF